MNDPFFKKYYDSLFDETMLFLAEHEKTVDDIIFVTDGNAYCSADDFKMMANDYYYDKGFGIQHINRDLKIVGFDWWLERHEYDGSEWWEFKKLPTMPKSYSKNIKIEEEE